MEREWIERKNTEEYCSARCGFLLGYNQCALPEHSRHKYRPVWDETLKAWVNCPPHGRPGQGAKE